MAEFGYSRYGDDSPYRNIEQHNIALPLRNEAFKLPSLETEAVIETAEKHQFDIYDDGTAYQFVIDVAESRGCDCVHYTDLAVYLSVTQDFWEEEKSLFEAAEDVMDGVKKAHTQEVETVAENNGYSDDIEAGFVLGSSFPLKTVSDFGAGDFAFRVAERAEFIESDVGLSREKAIIFATYEWIVNGSETQSEAYQRTANCLGLSAEHIQSVIQDVGQWSDTLGDIFEGINTRLSGNNQSTGTAFETAAAAQTDHSE